MLIQRRKLIIIALVDILLIAALVIYFGIIRPRPSIEISGILMDKPIEIAEFHFIDNHNRAFTKDTIKNHWTFLFFGFTHCELICPNTMVLLNKMYKILEHDLPKKNLPQVVFISIDPQRDSIDQINRFINSFNPNFSGARAGIDETNLLEKQLHIIVNKFQEKIQSKNYTFTHSMDILLLNPEAKVQAYFSYPYQPQQIAKDYELLFKKFSEKI